jgi:hypothetical protein
MVFVGHGNAGGHLDLGRVSAGCFAGVDQKLALGSEVGGPPGRGPLGRSWA